MSKIHYFQRYHQKENVVTNNAMLLFSRLYHHSPKKFNKFLNSLLEDDELEVGVSFFQQERNGDSIPDGLISQESFKIVIETKLHNGFGNSQLINHLQSFGNESKSILIALSNVPIKAEQEEHLHELVKDFNTKNDKKIVFLPTTFREIIAVFRDELSEFDIELHEVIIDFEEFCSTSGLLPKDYPRMLIVPCGMSIKDNFQYRMYYDPATRTHSRATHIGLYNNKRVKGIGKIVNLVRADLDESTNTLKIITETSPTTEDQKQRIIGIIKASLTTLGWSIKSGHKFFCLDDLEKTNFVKSTSGGIMGKRYENLQAKTGLDKNTATFQFAEALNKETWK